MLSIVVKPETVQLVASETTVCQGESITFNCSANGNPTVRMYHLYVNEFMVNETSSTGVWNRTMTAGGVFVYKCTASNKIGITESMGVIVTVNGKHFFFIFKDHAQIALPFHWFSIMHLRINGIDFKIMMSNRKPIFLRPVANFFACLI